MEIAQLPYETPTPFQDVLSALEALGSPMLIAFSLVLSMRLKSRIADAFDNVITLAERSNLKDTRPLIYSRLLSARTVVIETLQAPMRVSDSVGWLSSLIVLDANHQWWERAQSILIDLRRGVTVSLIMQTLIALISWIFTVINSITSAGDSTTPNAISSSILWIWLVPVVTGWVAVGTQYRYGTTDRALHSALYTNWRLIRRSASNDNGPKLVNGPQEGVMAASGTIEQSDYEIDESLPSRNNFDIKEEDLENDNHLIGSSQVMGIPHRFGVGLTGAQHAPGPTNNYSRLLSHMSFCQSIVQGFRILIIDLVNRERDSQETDENHDQMEEANCVTVRKGLSQRLTYSENMSKARSITFTSTYKTFEMLALPRGRDCAAILKTDIAIAFAIAAMLQYGTTGGALIVAYNTLPVGIGCRAATYLLYAFLATVSFGFQTSAAILSHKMMLRHEVGQDVGKNMSLAFVVLRIGGSLVGAVNGVWLVISCFMQLAGLYDNW